MAIARKPSGKPAQRQDHAAERFIAAAGAAPVPSPEPADTRRRKPAMIRFDAALLARIDRAARRRGVSRSAWVQFVLSQALDAEEAGAS